MSHFYTVVILPKDFLPLDQQAIKGKIGELLTRYDENIEVEPYEKKCWCVGNRAIKEAQAVVAVRVGSTEHFRETFREQHRPRFDSDDAYSRWVWSDESDTLWEQHILPLVEAEESCLSLLPHRDQPDLECSGCNGTGLYTSTYNPLSKWDWWVIGGRWNGEIRKAHRDDSDGGFNYGNEFHKADENISLVEALDPEDRPFACVTPDGEWHQRAQMGWFGMTRNHDANWPNEWREILQHYQGHYAVGCDLHI